jgi:hypothetical protein
MLARLDGHFVASPPEKPYSFTPDDRPDETFTGMSRKVWVHQVDDIAPVVVQFGDDHVDAFAKVRALGSFGADVAWMVDAAFGKIKFHGFCDADAPVSSTPAPKR